MHKNIILLVVSLLLSFGTNFLIVQLADAMTTGPIPTFDFWLKCVGWVAGNSIFSSFFFIVMDTAYSLFFASKTYNND